MNSNVAGRQWKMKPLLFSMLNESSLLTICRRVEQSQGNIMQHFWAVCTKKTANKTSGIGARKILFHQDNALAHTSAVSMAKVHELGFKLASFFCTLFFWFCSFLFSNLKIGLRGKRISSDEEVIATVDEYFGGNKTSYFSEKITKLEER